MLMQAIDPLGFCPDVPIQLGLAQGVDLAGDLPDGLFQLSESFPLGRQQADGQGSQSLRDLVLKDRKGGLVLGADQNFLAGCEVVADDVCDGVRLTRARWTLHDDTVGLVEAVDDADLFLVERFGKEQVFDRR